MKKKKTFSIKLNKSKKNNKNIVLLVVASIAAALGTAVFGILKWKGKKGVDNKSKITIQVNGLKASETPAASDTQGASGTQDKSAESRPQPPARFAHRKLQPGELDWETLAKEKEAEQIRKGEIPDYMLRSSKKSKFMRGLKAKNWKIVLSSIAILLAVAVVCGNIAQYLRPSEAMAKESFTGIGKVVQEHGEDNPYKILDIVPSRIELTASELSGGGGLDNNPGPGDADPDQDSGNSDSEGPVSTTFTFTTGTLGYLAGSKVPFVDELEAALRGNPIFSHYASRDELFSKLVPGADSFPWIKYEEAYGGVHDVLGNSGWTLLFPNKEEAPKDENNKYVLSKMSEGIFYGTAVPYTDGNDRTGYDFVSADGTRKTGMNISGLSNKFVYIYYEGSEEDPAHWYPVDLATYYESFLPNGIPAYMPKADGVRMITIGEQGPNCAAGDYVYKFDGEVYSPVNPAEKVGELYSGELYNSVVVPSEDQNSTTTETTAGTSTETGETTEAESTGTTETTETGTAGTTETTETTETGTTGTTETTSTETTETTQEITSTETVPVQNQADQEVQESVDVQSQSNVETNYIEPENVNDDTLLNSRNTAFTSSWRKLADVPPGSISDNNVDGNNGAGDNDNGGNTGTGNNNDGNTGAGGGNNGGNTGTGSNDGNTGTDETGGNDNLDQPEQPTPPADNVDTPDTEPSMVETSYYVLDWNSFVVLSNDELAAMSASDDGETSEAGGAEDEYGIMPLDASQAPDDVNKFVYVGAGLGDYKLTEDRTSSDLIGVYNAPVYFRCQAGNDWLRQYVFSSLSGGDNANSSFRIEVTTVRADEVTPEMVYGADLVYMESGQNVFLNSALNTSYIQHGEIGTTLEHVNDMEPAVVSAILSRAGDDLMPVIVDYAITEETDKYANTNYQLLAKALLKRDLADFYDAMDDGANLIDNLRMNLGKGSDNDNNIDFPNKYSNNFNYSYVNQNIYVVKNEQLVTDDFAEFFDDFKANAGFGDVLAAIVAENTTLAEEDRIYLAVSKARAIQYIINFSVGIMGEFDDLTILELQPTANIDPETGAVSSDLYLHSEGENSEKTKLYWKTESMNSGKQILYSKKPFSITTDVKSVVEFNGEWEDINGTYDMIFIGLDGRNLNLGNDKPRRPVYNNNNLNGKVYHSGDDSGSGTYDSNDITSQKMMDLLEYLQAGYPIVVENDCFKDGTARGVSADSINTKYIGDDTWMFRFLSAAVSDEKYSESIFTVSDTMSSALFMARMRTSKPRIEVLSEGNSGEGQDSWTSTTASTIQRLVLDENNEYHGSIAYQIRNNWGEEYLGTTGVSLYLDMNYDGIFGVEELSEESIINEGNVIDVTFTGMGPGIVPWKLEVSDVGNEYRRDSVQGYFELLSAYEEKIRVLQVTAQEGNYSVDLEAMYKTKEDSMLACYLKGAEGSTNLAFEFETITPDTLNKRLGENAKYLNQWDIVVLTVDDGVTVDNTAFTNYINEGRSLLVCNQNKNAGSMGLSSGSLGWSVDDMGNKRQTFISLGASNLHRYAGLDSGMYQPQHGNLKAERINEGSILRYPYQVNGDSFGLGNTEGGLRASEYLLDFEDNLKSNPRQGYVTVWLTLGGNHRTAYGISPRDARNNYYCYSKGNVVYLAQSEYQYTYDAANNEIPDGKEGADECKFFVNALMAAYSAGVHGPEVSIVSGFAQNSSPMKSISVPFDNEWRETADDGTQGILDNTVDVYFKFADSNIGANKNPTVSFYYEDPAGEKEFVIDDKLVKVTPFDSEIWTVTDNKLVAVTPGDPQNPDQASLIPGKVYQIKAPVIALRTLSADKSKDTTNNAGIYVLVESEFTRTGNPYKVEGFGSVSLNRATLFLLE